MAEMVLIDTDILIDAGRGESDAVSCLEDIEQEATLSISAVTQMELMIGCQNKAELRALEKFLTRFQVIMLTEQASQNAIELLRRYRLSHGLLIADALISATAISSGAAFVTKNQRDYQFIAGLRLLAYPRPFPSASQTEPK